MERRNLALLCAGVLCFWLFALAFGTAEGRGVAVQAELPTAAPAAVEDVPVVDAAAQPQLSLYCTKKTPMSRCPLLPSPR